MEVNTRSRSWAGYCVTIVFNLCVCRHPNPFYYSFPGDDGASDMTIKYGHNNIISDREWLDVPQPYRQTGHCTVLDSIIADDEHNCTKMLIAVRFCLRNVSFSCKGWSVGRLVGGMES